MNILYLNHYAGSPALGMEYRPYYLAREWVRLGHRVQMLAADFSHVRARQPQLAGAATATRGLQTGKAYSASAGMAKDFLIGQSEQRFSGAAATAMQAVSVSTVNFATFSELAFQFTLTPRIVLQSLGFALGMGFIGGFIPAWRAARLKIVDCLRAA